MTGERLLWFRIASHLGLPVEELVERISAREFQGWLEYLQWSEERRTKEEYYFAQIAAEVRKSWVKDRRSVKTKDFLMSPRPPGKDAGSGGSKQKWLAFFSIKTPKD